MPMRDAKIPDSAKHPLSLQADYANPQLYGGAAMVAGILALAFSAIAALVVGPLSGLAFAALGAVLFLIGRWMYRRDE